MALCVGEVLGHDAGGDDGVVVGDLRRVEHLLRLQQRLAAQRADEFGIGCHTGKLRLEEAVHGLRTFRVDIVGQESGVDTRIGGQFLFVELLDDVQRHLGREPELLVAVHLQRGEVVERGRCLLAILLLHLCHSKRLPLDGGKGLFALFLRGELSLRSREGGVAIDGGQHPVGLGLEVVNLFLAVDDEGEGGSLYTTDAEHLAVLAILDGVETGAVDTQ